MHTFFYRLLALFFFAHTAYAQAPTSPSKPMEADRIVAIVNDEVITAYELQNRLTLAVAQLKSQGTTLPPQAVLEKQMLERMVMDKIQIQRARELGLRVDENQLDQAIQRIAANNKMELPAFREALDQQGVAFAKFREDIRNEIMISRVREREVEARIVISESEIDQFLAEEASGQNKNEEYEVAHILLRAPESATPEQIAQLKAKTDGIYQRLLKGEDFAQMAAAYSDAPDSLRGGYLGARPLDRLPSIFAEPVSQLAPGGIATPFRSPNGFHIVKLIEKRGSGVLPAVQQTRARHILIKVSEVVSETEARHKLSIIHERIKHGAKFEDLARVFSQDGAASKGGDLGWVYPGDTVPEFEQAMDQLKPGEMSGPVRSPFGFHLIQVIERRVQDASADRKRGAIRQILKERRFDETYQDWLRQERDRAYVEMRLE